MNVSSILTKEQRESGLSLYEDNAFIFLTKGKEVLHCWHATRSCNIIEIKSIASRFVNHKSAVFVNSF
jgi:hypothetical protein